MKVEMSRLDRVFGDRILVRKLSRPEKMRGILVPASYLKEKTKQQSVWFAVIEKFGLDSRYGEAYGLKEGDIVGISDIGTSNASFEGDDGQEHFWVMEEFLVLKDEGRIKAYLDDAAFSGVGLIPLGAYSVVKAHPAEEEAKNGVILPHTGDNPQLTGLVVSVSSGEVKSGELVPLRVRKETEVLFGKYSGLLAKFNADEYLLIKEEDLIAELSPVLEVAHA